MDEDVFFNTAKENAHNFLKVIEECGIKEFVKREDYIALRSCTTTELLHQACAVMTADIDGVVLEHFNLSGITHPLRYINILPSGSLSLIPMFKLIKKHLPLINYTKQSYGILKEAVGAQIFSDGGWQFMATILPKEDCQSNIDGNSYRALVFDWLSRVNQCMG
ncbi:hypothetical protein SNE40_004278 [Patella caerulea]|uniref:Uncharacterized protein n=1 Tax=Patella caerulea TaxID=87958 RepID=A0AAN8KBF3_PATCE